MKSPFAPGLARRSDSRPQPFGFTLIELLVVISIIGVLAAMLLPVLNRVKTQAKVGQAKMEMTQLVGAIRDYDSANNRFPVSRPAIDSAAATRGDFTFGTYGLPDLKAPGGNLPILSTDGGVGYQTNNAEVMAVLLDMEYYGNGLPTRNLGHVLNTKRTKYLNANIVSDITKPGVGPDGVYRDPWGQPYIITIDLNNDEKARDAFYRLKLVSRVSLGSPTGLNGLFNPVVNTGDSDDYQANMPVMVWSAGPDKMIDPNAKANEGANKDNVLSWKQ